MADLIIDFLGSQSARLTLPGQTSHSSRLKPLVEITRLPGARKQLLRRANRSLGPDHCRALRSI